MSLVEKMANLNSRLVYVILIIVTLIPVIWPAPLPIKLTPQHEAIYNYVENLRPGDVVLMSAEYTASTIGDLNPPFVALTKHALKKDLRVIFVSLTVDGPVFTQNMTDLLLEGGKQYGTDFVDLGYVAGGEQAIASMAESFVKTFPLDLRGNPTESLPLMTEVKSAQDVKVVIQDSEGGLGPLGWIRQLGIPHKTPIATVVQPLMVPSALPYYQANQVIGVGAGLRFAAEYETLIHEPGRGLAGMGAQSFSHVYFLVLILVGNIGYLASKKAQAGDKKEG